jgi:hypothetical protein
MQLRRVALLAVLLAVAAATAYAGPIDAGIIFRQGGGSTVLTGLTFSFTSSTGSDCGPDYPDCDFINGTGQVITSVQLFIQPTTPDPPYSCAVEYFFNSCTVTTDPNGTDPEYVTITFFDGSIPLDGDFNLDIEGTFGDNSGFNGGLNQPAQTPEPGSAALLLTALAGILVVRRWGFGTGSFGA